MEPYKEIRLVIKGNKVSTLRTWLNRSQSQRSNSVWIHLHEMSRKDSSVRTERRLLVAWGWRWKWNCFGVKEVFWSWIVGTSRVVQWLRLPAPNAEGLGSISGQGTGFYVPLCPPPGDLPNPGIEPTSLRSSALAGRFFTTSATWEAPTKTQRG